MKTFLAATVAALSASSLIALPCAEVTSFTQDVSVATIAYTLTESPAIVTLDIQTNVAGNVWASIGGENIVPGVSVDSDVFKKVTGVGSHMVKWTPNRSWADHNQAANKTRAVVKAW